MNFPKSRIEILDTVAGIVKRSPKVDGNIDPEAKKKINLTLMFWSDVEDKSLPEENYPGLDIDAMIDAVSVRELFELDFISGANEYVQSRESTLLKKIREIESEEFDPQHRKRKNIRDVGFVEHADNHWIIAEDKHEAVCSLRDLGLPVIDSVMTFQVVDVDGSMTALAAQEKNLFDDISEALEIKLLSSVDLVVKPVLIGQEGYALEVKAYHDKERTIDVMDACIGGLDRAISAINRDMKVGFSIEMTKLMTPGHKDYADYSQRVKKENQSRAYEQVDEPSPM